MIEIFVRDDSRHAIDVAIYQFSRMCRLSRLISDMRKSREYEKPSTRRRMKKFKNWDRAKKRNERLREKFSR